MPAKMTTPPDYRTLRSTAPFRWRVAGMQSALIELAGAEIRQFNLDPDVGVEVYRQALPRFIEMFGPDVTPPAISTPAISYGHINTLGAELVFPQGGEVSFIPPCRSLQEGIELLKRPIDFAASGMAPFYLQYKRRLGEAFPEADVLFCFGHEGPVTTAYTLLGMDFFVYCHDQPDLLAEFLRLETQSIVRYVHWRGVLDGRAPLDPRVGGLADDIASMLAPEIWPRFVLPFWDQYFSGITTGRRVAHVEDLRPAQLPLLESAGLAEYDPSISPKVNPRLIARRCRVPFSWRLGSFHYRTMSCQDVRDFVFKAVADGASCLCTLIEGNMCNEATLPKVTAFVETARQVDRMLRDGATRSDIGACVSAGGRKTFWDRWPE